MKFQWINISLITAYTLLVIYLSLTRLDGPVTIHIWDKAAHTCVYFGFAVLSGLVTRTRKQFTWLILAWFCFGILIEILQGLTPYRSMSGWDQLANTTGLLLGATVTLIGKYYLTKRCH